MSFVLKENAKNDLLRIYQYGLSEFGLKQADNYFYALFDQFKKIAEQPYIFPSIDYLRPGYRRCVFGSDSIYYRINGSEVEIMAILGGQDTENWL